MDLKDVNILNVMQQNARLSYRQLAEKTRVSTATVINRIKSLEAGGIIKKYAAMIDYEKAGYDVQAVIMLQISKGRLIDVEKKIAVHPNVSAVYDTTGAFDAIVIAKFKTRRNLDNFLKAIQIYDFVERTETMLILNTIKEENIEVV